MFYVASYPLAVALCVVTMICWGSWANTTKLASDHWRFELFYWDYALGILALSVLAAFTLGSAGEGGRSFLPDLAQADAASLGSALLGGVLFNAANILLVAAIAIAGMSVAFPVGIGLALVIGVIVNYLDVPEGDPTLLFGGVALVAAAIVLNALAYRRLTRGRSSDADTASGKGLLLAVVAGCLMGLFYKYVAQAMFADPSLPEAGKLSPYTAVVVFSVGIFVSTFLFNGALMARPFVGEPVGIGRYFAGARRDHLVGLAGGAVWCVGMLLNILAAGTAGPAISYGLGQGATVIAALWGIYVWREFAEAPAGTSRLLNIMLVLYVLGLGLIIGAR